MKLFVNCSGAKVQLFIVLLFSQEEKIEPANGSSTFNVDSSWKIPNNSHVLMMTSQVSSEFEKGNQSYLRLSLGEFFERRSEALGCLGNTDDEVKRVRKIAFLLRFTLKPLMFPLKRET